MTAGDGEREGEWPGGRAGDSHRGREGDGHGEREDRPVGDLAAELRALADVLIDRVDPWLSSLAAPGEGPGSCSWCPVCALVAALRGDRPELARRLAEQGGGLLNAVRLLVAEHGGAQHARHTEPGPAGQPPGGPGAAPAVEPIVVRRRDATG